MRQFIARGPQIIPGGYHPQGVNFNGATYLESGGLNTVLNTGATGALSFSVSVRADVVGDGTSRMLATNCNNAGSILYFQLSIGSSNQIQFVGRDSTPSVLFNLSTTTDSVKSTAGWVHIMGSCDVTGTTAHNLYVNGSSDCTVNSHVTGTLNYGADFSIGARCDGSNLFTGDMANLWIETTYIDFTNLTQRQKFYNAGLVDLGVDGSIPLGAAPDAFFSGSVGAWQTNKGTGGGTNIMTGALSASSSNP